MKLQEIIDVYNLIDSIANENQKIVDYAVENNCVWVTLSNGKEFYFCLEEKK